MRRILYVVAAALIAGCLSALAASVPNLNPSSVDTPGMLNALNLYNAQVNSNITTQSMAGWQVFRNYLHNGEHLVAQRGTGTVTGGTTSGCAVLSYVSDRWCIDTNVGSGAGQAAVITTSPAPPPGFTQSVKVWRNSGALTQQVCALQELRTSDAVALQGQTVIFSMYAQPLAALTSASGAVQAYLFTGTGTDQGLGALRSAVGMTASTAITPAWTGIAGGTTAMAVGAASPSWNLGTTAVWSRLYTAPTTVPVTATEVAIAICFTPVGSASGATDGFAFTGAQLEVLGAGSLLPSNYEHVPFQSELYRDQAFYWQFADPAATVEIPSSCFVTAANTTVKCGVYLPTVMDAAPVTAVSVATSFGIIVTAGTAGTCTTLAATASSNSKQSIGVTCTTGGTIALGSATPLIGAATAGNLNASADF